MTPPLIAFDAVVKKHYGAVEPLRLNRVAINATDRLTVGGLDGMGAEMLMHLISGASVPDAGHVRIAGVDTRGIATDTEWLRSLDRFGIVTHRAVLLGTLPAAANIALPMTLVVDPMTAETRAAVERLADDVGLRRTQLDAPCGTLPALDRLRLHLARALATAPQFLLLEHPTAQLDDDQARIGFGKTLHAVAAQRGVGWLAVSNDRVFARAASGVRTQLNHQSGALVRDRWWHRRSAR